MASLSRPLWPPLVLVLLVLSLCGSINRVAALNLQYCSSINTAGTAANMSMFQSNGLCYNFCVDNAAFAILQVHQCWCSDFVPSSTTSLSDCDTPCPGYPDDMCASDGLFAYIALTKSPSGTAGGGSSPSKGQTTPPPTTSSFSSTWTPTPTLSLETVTGQVRTVTITPTAPPGEADKSKSSKGSGLSSGAIIGISVASILGGGVVLALLVWAYLAKRRRDRAVSPTLLNFESKNSNEGRSTPGPSRTMSGNSRFVLETNGEKVVQSFVDDGPSNRRGSQMLPVDPRLDPFNKLYHTGNQSRDSIATIRDEHDYSRKITPTSGRVLRAMNPDE